MRDPLHVLFVVVLSVMAAGAIVFILETVRLRRGARLRRDGVRAVVFLLREEALVDASAAARALLAAGRAPDAGAVVALLSPRFPDLAQALRAAAPDGTETLPGRDPADHLIIERFDGCLRLTVSLADPGGMVERLRLSSLESENATLRAIAEDAPQLIWKEDAAGQIAWANRSYLALADALDAATDGVGEALPPAWPVAPVFAGLARPATDGAQVTARSALRLPDRREPQWFEVTQVRRGAHVMGFAVDATGAVAAEEARHTFVQTLTKTFATLKAGLAIFDRQRRLVLFNPAFVDLTGLRIDFLSQRPLVHSVLDRLRDMQMLPEPKNYASWREQVAALEAAAEQGTYCETWVLPAGQTYRVSGRPHPDGALAFLIEDISDEVSLTRRFRLEQETVQATLDLLPQAVAVFSPNGTLTLSNGPYDALWGEGEGGLRDATLWGEVERWRARAVPAPVWDRLRGLGGDLRARRQELLRLADGRTLALHLSPLPGGSLLAEFRDPAAGEGLSIVPPPGLGPEPDLELEPAGPLRGTGT